MAKKVRLDINTDADTIALVCVAIRERAAMFDNAAREDERKELALIDKGSCALRDLPSGEPTRKAWQTNADRLREFKTQLELQR